MQQLIFRTKWKFLVFLLLYAFFMSFLLFWVYVGDRTVTDIVGWVFISLLVVYFIYWWIFLSTRNIIEVSPDNLIIFENYLIPWGEIEEIQAENKRIFIWYLLHVKHKYVKLKLKSHFKSYRSWNVDFFLHFDKNYYTLSSRITWVDENELHKFLNRIRLMNLNDRETYIQNIRDKNLQESIS